MTSIEACRPGAETVTGHQLSVATGKKNERQKKTATNFETLDAPGFNLRSPPYATPVTVAAGSSKVKKKRKDGNKGRRKSKAKEKSMHGESATEGERSEVKLR